MCKEKGEGKKEYREGWHREQGGEGEKVSRRGGKWGREENERGDEGRAGWR